MFSHMPINQRPIFFIDYTFLILYQSLILSIVTIFRLLIERLRKKGQELINNISPFIFTEQLERFFIHLMNIT